MKYDVTNSIWFDKIGIVEVKTKYSGIKYYICEAKGLDQKQDEQYIARVGMPINQKMILEFFKKQIK